jgi:hypothetical protein
VPGAVLAGIGSGRAAHDVELPGNSPGLLTLPRDVSPTPRTASVDSRNTFVNDGDAVGKRQEPLLVTVHAERVTVPPAGTVVGDTLIAEGLRS